MKQSIRQSLKHPNFFEGVAVAFALSVLGSAFALVLAPLFGRSFVGYVLISGVSFIYLIYLLARSQERVGRITRRSALASDCSHQTRREARAPPRTPRRTTPTGTGRP